jgi:hypothetical protein
MAIGLNLFLFNARFLGGGSLIGLVASGFECISHDDSLASRSLLRTSWC